MKTLYEITGSILDVNSLLIDRKELESMLADECERRARIVESDLYQEPRTHYQIQYNDYLIEITAKDIE